MSRAPSPFVRSESWGQPPPPLRDPRKPAQVEQAPVSVQTYELARWDDVQPWMLTKPCGCKIYPFRIGLTTELSMEQFERHDTGYCRFDRMSEDDLRREIGRMVEDGADGEWQFKRAYRRKRKRKQQERARQSVLELSDRLERELGIGAYTPLNLELAQALAEQEQRVNGDATRQAMRKEEGRLAELDKQVARGMGAPTHLARPLQHGDMNASISSFHDYAEGKRSYFIKLDAHGQRLSGDEIARQVQDALTRAVYEQR